MRTLVDVVPASRSPLAVVLLSGSFSAPEDFVREGFVSALRERGIDAQVVMTEMRMAWFADGSVVQRIRDAAILPALQRGARRVWLAGISLGGLATLCHAARHPGEAEGMVLMSPYPGTREVQREIEAAGGLGRWKVSEGAEPDLERDAWTWLATRAAATPDVFCYFGSNDRFVDGQRTIARALAPGAAHEIPGGHEWSDWRRMWHAFLALDRLR
jgi:pimeloyl-ACP methyl ester carboxylesterase